MTISNERLQEAIASPLMVPGSEVLQLAQEVQQHREQNLAMRVAELEGLLKRAYPWVRDASARATRNDAQSLVILIERAMPHPNLDMHATCGDGLTRCGLHLVYTFPVPRHTVSDDDVNCVACITAYAVEMEGRVKQYAIKAAEARQRIEILETPLSSASVDAITKDEP